MKKRIGLIGAGNRAKGYNLPILKLLADKAEVVGITTKSGRISEEFECLNAPVFKSVTAMAKETNPDVLILSIKSYAVLEVLDEVLSTNIPFVLETTDNSAVYSKLESATAPVGVLEQWPFLPLERFKKQVIESGVLGQIISVENDFRTYDYHGSAQVRNYLPGFTPPKIVGLKGFSNIFKSEYYVDKEGDEKIPALERMKVKVGIFENGTLLVYKFSDRHKNMPFRNFKSLKVSGTRGSIIGDCLLEGDYKISVLDDEGTSRDAEIQKEYDGEYIKSISCELPGGQIIEWKNTYGQLSEHQLARAHLFEEMLINENIIYPPESAIQDMIIAYASEGGASWN
tara:strand:+ start:193 stop:1218 length:1026 start_codon:yes stop_codon:yes gene_type:complete